MAMRFPSCWAPFQTLSAAPPRVASRSVRKGTRLAVAIHGTRVPPRAQAVVPRSPKARRRGAAADCALRDGGAGNSRRRGEGAEHGARRGFPRRPARNVRDCSRDVTTRELPPAGAGAGSHTSAAAREPRPGLPRGRAAALARFDRAERCCSERRHFGSEASGSLRYGEPQVSESFASAVGVGEEERWEPICRSRFLSKRRNAGRCWGLFVRVFPPEQASETVSGRRRNDWEF
ncbi:uncharacterized protein LOC110389670 isoform X2 [Numida meleagris]|uniref:uncharacterized protein LOC110389670 isoform X2 n=1 Tax=Numida meleagris TaxID=8996 RepID=UPI000B3DE704|nr:uncharacterized protein LOC110389670 isoform X2 [Numida meleagris]